MIEQLISRVFYARNLAHYEHWRTKSYAQHQALGSFYDGVIDALDALVEAYQGVNGLVGQIPAPKNAKELRITADHRAFWSFRPIRKPAVPATRNNVWSRTDIDRFVLAKLEEKGLEPNGPAQKSALLDFVRSGRGFLGVHSATDTFYNTQMFLNAYGVTILDEQGRLLYDLFVVGRDEGCWLDVLAEHRAAILQRLTIEPPLDRRRRALAVAHGQDHGRGAAHDVVAVDGAGEAFRLHFLFDAGGGHVADAAGRDRHCVRAQCGAGGRRPGSRRSAARTGSPRS